LLIRAPSRALLAALAKPVLLKRAVSVRSTRR
jgi:hypothetical protein